MTPDAGNHVDCGSASACGGRLPVAFHLLGLGRSVVRVAWFTIVATVVSPVAAEEGGSAGELIWKNGDRLPGELGAKNATEIDGAGADPKGARVIWRSEIFQQPMSIDPAALEALVFDPAKIADAKTGVPDSAKPDGANDATDRFRIVTIAGDVLDGALVGIDKTEIKLRLANQAKPGAGETIAVARSSIAELIRLGSADVLLHGLGDPGKWQDGAVEPNRNRDAGRGGAAGEDQNVDADPGWRLTADGRFVSERWRATAVRKLTASDRYIVDLRLVSFDQRPEFVLGLDPEANHVRVETWEDELVLTAGDEFEPVLTLPADLRDLRLLIGIDFEEKSVSAFDELGTLLARLDISRIAERWKRDDTAVFLKNTGADLELKRLSVMNWPAQEKGLPRVALPVGSKPGELPHRLHRNGRGAVPGELLSMEGEGASANLVFRAKSEVLRVPLVEVGIVSLAPVPTPTQVRGDVSVDHLSFFDGRHVSGAIREVGAAHVVLESRFSPQPIRVPLAGASRLQFAGENAAGAGKALDGDFDDRLFVDTERRLRGRVMPGQDGATFAWLSPGASEAVPLRTGVKSTSRIVRGALPGEGESAWSREENTSDRLVLKSREIVSCRVTAIDAGFVHFEQPMVSATRVPVELLRAVEFASPGVGQRGFEDARWRSLSESEDAVERDGGKVTLVAAQNGGVMHDSLLGGEEIRFRLSFGSIGRGGALRLGLFHGGGTAAESNASADREGLDITILASGDRVWVMKVDRGQPFSFSNNGLQGIGEWPQSIRVRMLGNRLEVYVGEQLAMADTLSADERAGHGLVLATDPMSVRYGGADSKIVVEDLVVLREKGSHSPIRVSGDARREAVTVPRFRRGTPQEHVLIAGNGDLLRGHLVSADEKDIVFRSRLEEVVVPRERVAAAVWLQALPSAESKDDSEPVPAAVVPGDDGVQGMLHVIMNDGSRMQLSEAKMRGERIDGRSAHLGDCRIPLEKIRELKTGIAADAVRAQADSASDWYADWKLIAATEPDIPEPPAGASEGGAGDNTLAADSMNEDRPGPGAAAELFELALLGGGDFTLKENLGSIVVLDFWATWCGPCVRAIPAYQEALNGFDPEKVRFVGINQAEAAAEVASFMEGRGWEFAVAMDSDGAVADRYGVTGIPHTVVVDSEGKIAWVHTGFAPGGAAELKRVIDGLLEKKERAEDK